MGKGGGGSMMELEAGFDNAGSGNAAIVSSADEVSIEMCVVGGADARVV